MTDLEFISTDELLDELTRRFDHAVFSGSKEVDGLREATNVQWRGDTLKCLGLAEWARDRMLRDFGRARKHDSA